MTRPSRFSIRVADEQSWGDCGSTLATSGLGQIPPHPAAIYFYEPDRRSERPATHLAKFKGVLHVDAYAGVERLTVRRCCACRLLGALPAQVLRDCRGRSSADRNRGCPAHRRTLYDRGEDPRAFTGTALGRTGRQIPATRQGAASPADHTARARVLSGNGTTFDPRHAVGG